MRLKCKWRHARKRWSWEFEDFEKSQLGVDFGPCRQTVGLSANETNSWSWGLTMMVKSWIRLWCWEVGVRPGSWDFEVGLWKTIVEFPQLEHRVGFRPLKDVVSIVWLRKTFNNCVSLLVSRNRSQKSELINGSYLNNRVACVFKSTYCIMYLPELYSSVCCICTVGLISLQSSLWLWQYNTFIVWKKVLDR